MHYYASRKVWLVEPDSQPAAVMPYQATPEVSR